MNENKIEELLNFIPDKFEAKTTTSKLWKRGLVEYVIENNINSILEVGGSLGHTAYIVSPFVDYYGFIEIAPDRVRQAKTLNKDNPNIKYFNSNVYVKSNWENFGPYDLAIIDCIHDYSHVNSDINNAIEYCGVKYLAFDDYGLFPEIKKAIDERILENQLKVIKFIGHPSGVKFPKTQNVILKDWEGLICQVIY